VRAGDQLPALRGFQWSDHNRTLVLALKDGCVYCDNSMPFYRRLATLQDGRQAGAFLIAAVPDSSEKAKEMMERHNLSVPVVAESRLNTLKVAGTPTLILVDKQGKVLKVWVGVLSVASEDEVIRRIRS